MSTLELLAYLCFAFYLVAFVALTRAVARSGSDPWLFGRAGGAQSVTGWAFQLGFAFLLAMPLVHMLAPGLELRIDPWPRSASFLGAILALAGANLALWAQAHMRGSWRIGATEDHVGRLVVDGPFAWSRNPVFIGQIALVLGVFLAGGDAWVGVAATAVTLAALVQAAIEERVLLASLGEEYRDYSGRVARWFGRPWSARSDSASGPLR